MAGRPLDTSFRTERQSVSLYPTILREGWSDFAQISQACGCLQLLGTLVCEPKHERSRGNEEERCPLFSLGPSLAKGNEQECGYRPTDERCQPIGQHREGCSPSLEQKHEYGRKGGKTERHTGQHRQIHPHVEVGKLVSGLSHGIGLATGTLGYQQHDCQENQPHRDKGHSLFDHEIAPRIRRGRLSSRLAPVHEVKSYGVGTQIGAEGDHRGGHDEEVELSTSEVEELNLTTDFRRLHEDADTNRDHCQHRRSVLLPKHLFLRDAKAEVDGVDDTANHDQTTAHDHHGQHDIDSRERVHQSRRRNDDSSANSRRNEPQQFAWNVERSDAQAPHALEGAMPPERPGNRDTGDRPANGAVHQVGELRHLVDAEQTVGEELGKEPSRHVGDEVGSDQREQTVRVIVASRHLRLLAVSGVCLRIHTDSKLYYYLYLLMSKLSPLKQRHYALRRKLHYIYFCWHLTIYKNNKKQSLHSVFKNLSRLWDDVGTYFLSIVDKADNY